VLHARRRKRYQCKNNRPQTTLSAGTIFEATKLELTIYFQAIYAISQAKAGFSALALKRQPGVNYLTSWMTHHNFILAVQQRDAHYLLCRIVQIEDACLGGDIIGDRAGGKCQES
jgi:hypothetical protein